VIDSTDFPLGALTRRVSIPRGATVNWSVKALAPIVPAVRNYFILARIDAATPIRERQSANNAARAAAPIKLSNPPSDLSVAYAVQPDAYAPGQYVNSAFRVINRGMYPVNALLPIRVYATTAAKPNPARDLLVLKTSFRINLRPRTYQDLPAYFPAPPSLTGQSVLFYITIDSTPLGDPNPNNNTAPAQTRVLIT
jgi:hypothetical protein